MMMYSFGLLLLTACAHGNIVKRSACSQSSTLTADQIQAAVQAHNDARAEVHGSDITKLEWDDELAARAQDWANACTWKHQMTDSCDGNDKLGQNLYMSGGGSGSTIPDLAQIDVTPFVDFWDSEEEFYSIADNSCTGVCGHFTQVVWSRTMKVGCAMAYCDSVATSGDPFPNAVVFACDYSPPGNMVNQWPYQQGNSCETCSNSITTGWRCENDIFCVPCTRAGVNGDTCTCVEKECQNGGVYDNDQCVCSCVNGYFGETCEDSCVDAAGYDDACAMWEPLCTDPLYTAFMHSTCPGTCGYCD